MWVTNKEFCTQYKMELCIIFNTEEETKIHSVQEKQKSYTKLTKDELSIKAYWNT